MRQLSGILVAGLVISGAAHSQEWQTYAYRDPGFAIQFPGVPNVQTSRIKNAAGVNLSSLNLRSLTALVCAGVAGDRRFL